MNRVATEIDLSANVIAEPLNAIRVGENRFAVASYAEGIPHMITCGLSVCTALIIYDPELKKGLLAHITAGGDVDKNLTRIVRGYADDLSVADVTVVETIIDETGFWPSLESIAEFFLKKNPRNLRVDRNAAGTNIRGIALNLEDGFVCEIDGTNGWTWSEGHDTTKNQFIYSTIPEF